MAMTDSWWREIWSYTDGFIEAAEATQAEQVREILERENET